MSEQKKSEKEKKQIDVVVGQPVQITLQSMVGSTGYSWYLTKLSGGLGLSHTASVPSSAVPGQIAPTNQIFTFLATNKGTCDLEFDLIAPWRPDEPGDTEIYKVKIEAPKKTAADDIASAMKGREFISASAVNVAASDVIKYAAPMEHPTLKYGVPVTHPMPDYAAPMAMCRANILPTTVQPYAAPWTQARSICAPADPCLDPRNSALAAQTMIAYAAPSGPSTVAAMDPCLDPGNRALAAKTMIAYAAPVRPTTVAAIDPCFDPGNQRLLTMTMIAYAAPMRQIPSTYTPVDPCLDPRNCELAARAMIAYAAPSGPSTVAAMNQVQPLYAAPMSQACPVQPVYAAPVTQAGSVQPLYAAPMSQACPTQPLYAAPMIVRYAAPYCC